MVLMLLVGYLLGTFGFRVEEAHAPMPIRMLSHDIHRRAPFVRIRGIENGMIVGTVGTGARLVIGGTVVLPHADRNFQIDAGPLLVNVVDIPVPEDARFIASTRGKNYYPIASSQGQRIVPGNRLYFGSAAEAERAGYRRGR